MLFQRLGVFGGVPIGQQRAMYFRMERLDTTIHHFGKAGDVGDVLHRDIGLLQGRLGAAGRQQFDAGSDQRLGGFDQADLVGQRNQGAFRGDQIGGGRKIGSGGHGLSVLCGLLRNV